MFRWQAAGRSGPVSQESGLLKWSEVTGHTVQPEGVSGLMCSADKDPLKQNKTKKKVRKGPSQL